MVKKKSFGEIIFTIFNYLFMIALCIICIIPMWHVAMASVSDPTLVNATSGLILRPLGQPSVTAYKIILNFKGLLTGYANTIFYVIAQCAITGILSVMGGYIVSKKTFRYRNFLMLFMIFTMLFNGGMIPSYMVVRNLNMIDTRWAMLIPSALSVFNIIIMRTAIQGVPDSLEESARMDGANDFVVMFRIILPLCKASFAVVMLFTAIGKWNEWFNAMIYLPTKTSLLPLQMFMRELLIKSSGDAVNQADMISNAQLYMTLVKYAAIIVSTLPILCVYPFVQKYFVKGVMIGSVKG